MTRAKAWKTAAAAVAVALGGAGVALAASGNPGGPASPAGAGSGSPGALGPGRPAGSAHPVLSHLAHAEATVVFGGQTHVVRIDHGIVRSVSADVLTVEEPDGTTVAVPIGPDTRFFVDGHAAAAGDIQEGDVAFTLRDGDSPARCVRAFDPTLRPSGGGPAVPAPGPTDPASAAALFLG